MNPPTTGWSLVLRHRDWKTLSRHLFSAQTERGAVLLAEQVDGPRGPRLLVREVIKAKDGTDYVPGTTGHRALHPDFVRSGAMRAHSRGLVYVAVHSHGGHERVSFSKIDLASHERGYPALVQLTGRAVVGLVLTPGASAGDIWLPGGGRADLSELVIAGKSVRRLRPEPHSAKAVDGKWDRQARVFGDAGQEILRELRVGVVGLGGAGSIITELIARLGVGTVVLIDNDKVDEHNLPRLVAAEESDIGAYKTSLAARNARRANSGVVVEEHQVTVQDAGAIRSLMQCDFIFLSADSAAARHFVNQAVETNLIPGVQVGVKVPVDGQGRVGRVHAAVRPMVPGEGCLRCNGLINATDLALDMQPAEVQRVARYVEEVPAPSVIALNSIVTAEAVNQFMMGFTGLLDEDGSLYSIHFPREGKVERHEPRRESDCELCGDL